MAEKKENKQIVDTWKPITVLRNWKKKNADVEIVIPTGLKLVGKIMSIEKYEITIWNKKDNKKYVIYKSNIAYISKVK